MLKIIGSEFSPYARKTRIVAAEKRIEIEYELSNPNLPGSSVSDFNPLGKVPVLVMEDGNVVFDSRVIVEYLDMISPLARLIPESARQRIEVRCWEALADGICDAALNIRYEHAKTDAPTSKMWVERQMGKITRSLKVASDGLEDRVFCCGTSLTLADIALGVALCYLDVRFPEIKWRDYPNLARLHEKMTQRQSFIDTAATVQST